MTFEAFADALLAEAKEQTRLIKLIARQLAIDPAPAQARHAQAKRDRAAMPGGFAASQSRRRNLKRAG